MIPKFRAWDKNNKYMEYTDKNLVVCFSDEGASAVDHTTFGHSCTCMEDIELMQSTGLKDKNGVEIYEGDIIRGPYDTGIIGYEMVTTEVKYDLLKGFQLGQFDLNITEVIGNIYENPDLLEDN
ncbi:YopX family protein [Staphylococcus epidermidis]|nr:YopX family protein [Staphylococcus epidermidis]MDH8773767.1 YopX family protein [Staphylococcus epidermidis]MDH8818074.1 YopX family protein [Staphylococcus epidermidis]MDH8845021.1 YopX family protein [Staphylococcus epidermidis]MDH8862778.1 YopX family protein [Staphylococcus epidermidis]